MERHSTNRIALLLLLTVTALSCSKRNTGEEGVGAIAYGQLHLLYGAIEQTLLEQKHLTNSTVQEVIGVAERGFGSEMFMFPGEQIRVVANRELSVWINGSPTNIVAYFPRTVRLREGERLIGILGDGSRTNLITAPF